jgi:hypothetical protein
MTDLDMFLKVLNGVTYVNVRREEERRYGSIYTKITISNSMSRISIYFDDEGNRV